MQLWGGRVIQNAESSVQGDEASRLMRTYALTPRFIFLAVFLSYDVLFYLYKFNLTLIQIRCVRQKRSFFSNEISVCYLEISFF